jgi:hypothetical protein
MSFHDAGQGLLKRLDVLLGQPPRAPVIDLAPSAPPAPATPETGPVLEIVSPPPPAPTLKGFADSLVARFAARIWLVRQAPAGAGVLIVVDQGPAELRAALEAAASEYFGSSAPALHLMEPEGYRALSALLPAGPAAPDDEPYRAAALPAPERAGRAPNQQRLQKAGSGLDFAGRRLALAEVLLRGGFPDEMLRPIREALGWALTALLALQQDRDPSGDLPAPRLIQAQLVDAGLLPDDLAARLARVRELTEPPAEPEAGPPLTEKTGASLASALHELIEIGRGRIVAAGL